MKRAAITVVVNIVVLCVLLGGIEAYYRFRYGSARGLGDFYGVGMTLVPYVMLAGQREKFGQWMNELTGKPVPTSIESNNLGFNDHHDFDILKRYQKADNERVVVLMGASQAWGYGATSTENAIAGRMEHYLNLNQTAIKYTVINMAGPGWISYQEFVALELWGAAFNPDWVVVMDGIADFSVACGASQGVTNPLYFPAMRGFLNAYFGVQYPVYYRGWLENQIIKYSVAYRTITRQSYIPYNFAFESGRNNTPNALQRVTEPTKVGQARQMLEFYLKAQQAMLKLYPRAKYILSTAPSVNQFNGEFTDIYDRMDEPAARAAAVARRAHDMDVYLDAYAKDDCSPTNFGPALSYGFVMGAIKLEALVDGERSNGKAVEYHNLGRLFPNAREERIPYFVNPDHLSDAGDDVVGKFYAQRILAADAPAN